MTNDRYPPTPGIQTAVRKVLSGLRYEPYIPHGSGDAEYHLVNDHGQAVALIDPGMIFDDAADVAESIVLAVRSDAAAHGARDAFIRMIARLNAYGDDMGEGEPAWEHDTGDSLDTLDAIIHKARQLVGEDHDAAIAAEVDADMADASA